MAEKRPLLQFGKPTISKRESPRGGSVSNLIPPDARHQGNRFDSQIKKMESTFITENIAGLEIERVLVLKIFSKNIFDLRAAANRLGLKWLAEINEDELSLPEDGSFYKKVSISKNFFKKQKIVSNDSEAEEFFEILKENNFIMEEGNRYCWNHEKKPEDFQIFIPEFIKDKDKTVQILREEIENEQKKSVVGKLFLFMSNHAGMKNFLSLWDRYKSENLKYGEGKWKNIFAHLSEIRYWREEDRLGESNILESLKEDLKISSDESLIPFELEFWHKKNNHEKESKERDIRNQIADLRGDNSKIYFYKNDDVGIHLAKVNLPAGEIRKLCEENNYNDLFKKEYIKFVRPAGQNITDIEIPEIEIPTEPIEHESSSAPPVVALLDGLPVENHEALNNKIIVDDPDSWGETYMAKKRFHGTAMASLICNGDLENPEPSLERKIYVRPIMQLDNWGKRENVPEDIFFEDMIEKSIVRMFEVGESSPVASNVRVINLSVCHASKWFFSRVSSGGRLLDWLAWKYKILFCVSAGNFKEEISCDEVDLPKSTIESMVKNERNRRIMMPSDSINSLTVGSLHKDECEDFDSGTRVDILPCDGNMPSPISSFGHGYASSIKPEILLPGGRQLYERDGSVYKPRLSYRRPGQKVAIGSERGTNKYAYICGTSNANALATRGAGLIFEMLEREKFSIPIEHQATVLKTLLVHGARQGDMAKKFSQNVNKKFTKNKLSKYLGYGVPNIERVMKGTEKRVTIFGFSSIENEQRHEFSIPLPRSMRGSQKKRTLIITLSWLTPIDAFGSKYRSAVLKLVPKQYSERLLKIKRKEFDINQASRGTVQHDILSGKAEIGHFSDEESIKIPIECTIEKPHEDEKIPYALAVTLETEDTINIYEEIKTAIAISERVRV